MDENRYQELLATQQAMMGGASANEAYINNVSIPSKVSAYQTLGFIGDVGKQAEDYQFAKSIYNGAIVQAGRGLAGTGKMLNELYAERLVQNGYIQNKDDAMIGWNNIIESSPLQRYKVDDTFMNNVASGAGQLLGQAAVTFATGGVGGAVFMGSQIAGEQYLELTEEGVDTQRAAMASVTNAAIQAPLESIGFSKIIKANPAAKKIYQKAISMAESAITEAFTEGLQEFPEQLTSIWAKNKDIDLRGVAREWDKNATENLKAAGYSAAVAFVLGGAASGVRHAQIAATEKYMEKVHEDKLATVKSNIENIKSTGINPEFAAVTIDNNLRGAEAVSIDAQALNQYMQQENVNTQEVAEKLGVDAQEVQKAADEGQDIAVSYGTYVGASVALGDNFSSAMEPNIAFEDTNGMSVNASKLQKALQTNYELTEQSQAELDAEVDKIIESATNAGVADAQSSGLKELLISRAMIANPQNPAKFLKDHPLEFQNAGKVDTARNFYKQQTFDNNAELKLKNDEANWSKLIDDLDKEPNKTASIFRKSHKVMDTPMVFKFVQDGIEKLPIHFVGGKYNEIKIDHPELLSNGAIKSIPRALTDPIMIFDSKSEPGRKVVLLELQDSNNANVVVPFELNITKNSVNMNLMVTAYGKARQDQFGNYINGTNKTWVRDSMKPGSVYYINSKKALSFFRDGRVQSSVADSMVQAFAKSIPNENALVKLWKENPGYYQNDSVKDKGAISWNQDGKAIINLFKGADASTVIHETGHYFVEAFMQDSALETADAKAKKDRKALLKYVGMTEAQWNGADFEGRRAAHEKLAEAFETYIIEGKAPNKELRGVFRRFSAWLKAVYSSVVKNADGTESKVYDPSKRNPNAAEINDEVRNVFDHWLASQEEIEAQERINGFFQKLPKVLTQNLTRAQQDRIKDYIAVAHEKAVELMTKDTMQIFDKDRKEEIAKIRSAARERAEQDVARQKVYKASAFIKNIPGWERANAKTLARKYLSKGGQVYGDYAKAKAEIDQDINERIQPIIDLMTEGIAVPRTYWIDKETGQEVDVSDLEKQNADELKSGFQFQKVTEDASAYWWDKYRDANGNRMISRKKMRELAIDAYMGNDPYGILAEESAGLNMEQAEAYKQEIAERKAEMEELLKQQEMINAQSYQANLFKKFYMSDEMRVWWDLAAEQSGYASGSEMAQDIQDNPSYKEAVEQYLDNVVDQFLPDKLKDREAAEQAAREALYNDDSGMVVAVEQEIIEEYAAETNAKARSTEEKVKLARQLKAAAEQAARDEIAKLSLKDALKTRKYMIAERKAAANANKALKEGDTEGARDFKRQQAFNHAMARESLKMKQQIDKSIRFLKRLRKLKKDSWGAYEGVDLHYNQAQMLLQRMGVGRKDFDSNVREQTLAQYIQQQQQENGNYIDIADWLTNETTDISDPRQLTFEQYQDVVDALKNIRALANAQNKSAKLAKDVAWSNFKDEIREHLADMQERYRVKPGEKPKAKFFRELLVTTLRSTDNLLEFMDNWHYGYFSKRFGEPLKMCADMQSTMEMKFKEYASDAFKKWCPDKATQKAIEEKVYYEELGISCDKRWLIQMVANLGNEGNARMLCSTMPIEIQDAIMKDGKTCDIWVQPNENISAEDAWHQTRDNLVAFLNKYLTSADIEYAQSLIDNAGRHWNERAELDRRTKGFAPKKVEATPVAFQLADGSVAVLRGGYFPLVRDSRMGSHPANMNSVSDTDPSEGRNINPMHTNTGSSKNRTMATYPVSLIPGCEFRSVMDGIHDIAYREVIADFRKMFNDPDVVKLMKEKMGVAEYEHLRETIESTANPYGNTHLVQAERWQADCISWLRRKTVNAAIMLSLKTAFQNLSNVTLFGNAVEGFTQADAWRSVYEYGFAAADLRQRELYNFIINKSVFMKERVTEPDISLKEIINEGEMNAIEKKTTEWGAKFLAYTDNLTAMPCWMGAYNKKIQAGASEQEAINFADTIVRRTLGSSRVQDVSSLQRGGPVFKMLTTFQGFWNTQFNQWDREYHILRRDLSEGKRKEAIARMSAFIASKWIATCLIACAMGLANPFEDDKKGHNNWLTEIRQYPLSMLGPTGQAANFLINSALGTSTYSYRMAAIQSTIDKGIKLARTGNRFVNGKAGYQDVFEGITGLAGPVFGVPDEINKLFWNNYDYLFNGMTPELHDLVARRPKSER